MKKIGFLKKLALLVITKMQIIALKSDYFDLYYRITKFRFKLVFGQELSEQAADYTKTFREARKLHIDMVMKTKYSKTSLNKATLRDRISTTFHCNLILLLPLR